MGRYDYWEYAPYVSVAERRARAAKEVDKRIKKGQVISPVKIEGRKIARTFWGNAWCDNLESYSDYENRLPRGRTYVRNGSVVHLKIEKGRIDALVSGSEVYTVQIEISALPKEDWNRLKRESAGEIGTLVELLQGKLSKGIMELVTAREHGLFPKPKEIKMRCSCPDGARMCKHVAAVMYGIGSRLDASPESLFVLRGVDHLELIEQAIPSAPLGNSNAPVISSGDLGAIFDIEIGETPLPTTSAKTKATPATRPTEKKPKAPKKSPAVKAATKVVETPAPEQVKQISKAPKKKTETKSKTESVKAAPTKSAEKKPALKKVAAKKVTKAKATRVKK